MSKIPVNNLYAIESEQILCEHKKIPKNIKITFRQEKPIRLEERTRLRKIGQNPCRLCAQQQAKFGDCLWHTEGKQQQLQTIFSLDLRDSEPDVSFKKEMRKPKTFSLMNKLKRSCRNTKQFLIKTKSLDPQESFTWIMKPVPEITFSEKDNVHGTESAIFKQKILGILKNKDCYIKWLQEVANEASNDHFMDYLYNELAKLAQTKYVDTKISNENVSTENVISQLMVKEKSPEQLPPEQLNDNVVENIKRDPSAEAASFQSSRSLATDTSSPVYFECNSLGLDKSIYKSDSFSHGKSFLSKGQIKAKKVQKRKHLRNPTKESSENFEKETVRKEIHNQSALSDEESSNESENNCTARKGISLRVVQVPKSDDSISNRELEKTKTNMKQTTRRRSKKHTNKLKTTESRISLKRFQRLRKTTFVDEKFSYHVDKISHSQNVLATILKKPKKMNNILNETTYKRPTFGNSFFDDTASSNMKKLKKPLNVKKKDQTASGSCFSKNFRILVNSKTNLILNQIKT